MMQKTRGGLAVLTALLMLVAACSSTSPRGGRSGDGSADPSNGGAAPAATSSVPGSVAPSVGAGQTSGVASTGSGGGGGRAPGTTGLIPARAPGVDDRTIQIGIELLTNLGPVYSAVGANAPVVTDEQQRQIAAALFDYVNARGGFAGRKGVPVLHFTDIAQGTHDSRAQRACEFFTQDRPVFAVIGEGNTTDAFPRCLAKQGRPLLEDNGTFWPYDQSDLRELSPYLYLPSKLSMSRFGVYIDGLAAQGFFEGDVKIGLLRYDIPSHVRARDGVLKPALARYGKVIAKEFAFTKADTVADLSQTSAQASNAVLRFKQNKINRIIYLPSAQVIGFAFPQAAQSQRYYPWHGLNSAEGPTFWAENAPDEQLENMYGVGWRPLNDLGSTSSFRENRRWAECAAALKKRGLPEAGAYACGPVLMLREALSRASEVSARGLRAGIERMGSTAYSTENFSTYLGPGRYDGPASIRYLRWFKDCDCIRYTSPVKPIPR